MQTLSSQYSHYNHMNQTSLTMNDNNNDKGLDFKKRKEKNKQNIS